MAILIPEIRLQALIEELLEKIRVDDRTAIDGGNESDSFLFRILDGNEIDGISLLTQAREILNKGDENRQKLETRLMFDRDRAQLPTIHITLPSEGKGKENAIGFGADGRNLITNSDGSISHQYSRSFGTTYELAITSNDPIQVVIIYNIIKSGFIAIADSLELSGMKIPDFSGGDVSINQDLVPNVYLRAMRITLDYNYDVPTFRKIPNIDKINFDQATTL